MRLTRIGEKLSGKIIGQDYSNILFDELMINNTHITKTRFKNVHFKNSQLGNDSEYNDCEFIKCKFLGRHSTLGLSTKYTNCKFIDCKFTGVGLFKGSTFYNCTFSGIIKNAIIRDSGFVSSGKKTAVFNECDLSQVIFESLNLYGIGINNCTLPKNGIRKFKNDGDALINKAIKICSKIDSEEKIDSEIIFNKELRSGQNPIILDNFFLDSFFRTLESRQIFDSIVNGCEIK